MPPDDKDIAKRIKALVIESRKFSKGPPAPEFVLGVEMV